LGKREKREEGEKGVKGGESIAVRKGESCP